MRLLSKQNLLKKSDLVTNKRTITAVGITLAVLGGTVIAASDSGKVVSDDVVSKQRETLAKSTDGAGFGPQSPRDIDAAAGENQRAFQAAPAHTEMNLCNIHFHESAEHKGGDFTKYAGNGDGKGHGTGYAYSGKLTDAELAPIDEPVKGLEPGDTIEVHYVHTTAQITPGPTLGACLSDAIKNPQLRVETQVYVLVNDDSAHNFVELTEVAEVNGKHQAVNIPTDTGSAIQYSGSTTGPSYNEAGSPFQVSWSVRPKVAKVNIKTVGEWFKGNIFNEDHAHGVRNLVTNPALLSKIGG